MYIPVRYKSSLYNALLKFICLSNVNMLYMIFIVNDLSLKLIRIIIKLFFISESSLVMAP